MRFNFATIITLLALAGCQQPAFYGQAPAIGYVSSAQNQQADLSFDNNVIWGTPVDSIGEGVTLLNPNARARLNDALETTPVGQNVNWKIGNTNFVLMMNSPLYQPFYNGGSCRDAVFIATNLNLNDRKRGLFCQSGQGADWFLLQ